MGKPAVMTSDWWKTNWKLVLIAIGFIIFPYIGGSIGGGVVTREQIEPWYNKLNRPEWRPPNWLFGPVWAILYFCMGFASYLIWRDGRIQNYESTGKHCYFSFSDYTNTSLIAMGLYLINIALNWSWSPVFFVNHRVKDAFAIILVLDLVVLCCIGVYFKVNKWASLLMVPYMIWISFATALNVSIWQLNCDVPQPQCL